jgi:hypothetical protein
MLITRIYFVHGGGSTDTTDRSQDPFAQYLLQHYGSEFFFMKQVRHTSDFEQVLSIHTHGIREFQPDIIVCRSQGGPTMLHLMLRQIWLGPIIFCCPAIVGGIDPLELPKNIPFTIVVGKNDEQVLFDRVMKNFIEPNVQHLDSQLELKIIITEDTHAMTSCIGDANHPNSLISLIKDLDDRVQQLTKLGKYHHDQRIPIIADLNCEIKPQAIKVTTTTNNNNENNCIIC